MTGKRAKKAVARRFIAFVAAALALAASSADAQDVTVLRYASPYSPAHPFSRADLAWMKHVEQVSAGRIKIQPFWGGTLISGDHSVVELRHGVADVALITPIYMRGGMQAVKTQSGFYAGIQKIEGQIAVYRCLAQTFPVFGDELAGVRVLAVQGGSLPHVVTRSKPVRALDDLKGLRLRAPVELVPVLRKLGVDVVTMPMGEVYSAMSKGVIDGVVAPSDTLKALHFNEVARYMTLLNVPRGGYAGRAISETSWRKLPADLQDVLFQSTPFWEQAMTREIRQAESAGAEFGEAHGISFIPFPSADQARFDEIYDTTAEEQARALAQDGIDGLAIYRKARALRDGAGGAKACNDPT